MKEEITQQMNSWEQVIIEMQNKGEHILWIGDLNVKVGNDEQGIAGNRAEITHGGKILRKMIKKRNMKLINATYKCTGTWTRVNTGNKDQKSILDYVITSEKMEEKVKTMQIDEDGLYIPTRYKAETTVETDHRPIIIIIENNEQSEEEEKEVDKDTVKWNFRKETEVNRYKEKTAESEELSMTWRDKNNIQQQYDQWENCLKRILDKVFTSKRKNRLLAEKQKM